MTRIEHFNERVITSQHEEEQHEEEQKSRRTL